MAYRKRKQKPRVRTFHGRVIRIHIGNPHAGHSPFRENADHSGCTCADGPPSYAPSEPERVRERMMKGWSPPGKPFLRQWHSEGGKLEWVWR